MGYRDHYHKTFDELLTEELEWNDERSAKISAYNRLRMYANLYNRDLRKSIIKPGSKCEKCGSFKNLTVDHIIPITKGGANDIKNVQVLCRTCNILKSNRT